MEACITREDSLLTVAVSGRLDSSTVPGFESKLKECLPQAGELVFDFKNLEYISSAGLRVLLASHKLMAGNMKIINAGEAVIEVFKITGMALIFNIE